MGRFGFWLPAGIIAEEILRTGSAQGMTAPSALVELLPAAPCGLPLALACRTLDRLGYPGPALLAWVSLGLAAAAGLFIPLPAGVRAILASLPVWVAAWRLARRPCRLEFAPLPRCPGWRRSRGRFRAGR